MNGMFLKYICLVLLNGIWRKEGINIIRKGRKHTSKSPSSNLPEYIKPPRISFWDNIFYWSWYSTKHGLPHRTFATVTVIQYVYVVLFTAVILNCLDSQTAWHLYILHKSKDILGYILVPYVILFLVNGRIYKESRYERLKAEFDRMEISEKKRRRTIFWIFIGITLLAGYAAYRLFCRFNMQFLLP